MDFCKRLNALRITNGYTLEELGKLIGVGKSAISNYEKGYRYPKKEQLEALADLFNVDLDYLSGRSDIANKYQEEQRSASNKKHAAEREVTPVEKAMLNKFRALDPHGRQVVSFLLDAEYNRVQDILAASRGRVVTGSGTIAVPLLLDALSKKEVGVVPVPAVGEIKDDEAGLFALPVTQDTMAPLIMPGDSLIVREQSDVNDGDIAVVLLDGVQVVCKQVFKDGSDLRLVPLNKKYDEVIIHKEDIRKKKFEIIGRVVKNIQAG